LPFFILCTVLFATKLAKINQSSKSIFFLLMLPFAIAPFMNVLPMYKYAL